MTTLVTRIHSASGLAILLASLAVLALLVWTGLWALRRRRPRDVRRRAADTGSARYVSARAAQESARLASRPILLADPSWGWWPISDAFLLPPESDPRNVSGGGWSGQQDLGH